MAVQGFLYPTTPTGVTTGGGGPYVLGMEFTPSIAGQLVGVYYWKVVTDTTPSRVATLYRSSGAVNLGSTTFSGESASGWQTAPFTSIALTAGTTYRMVVQTGANNANVAGFSGASMPGATMSSTSYWANGTTGFPPNAVSNNWYGIDVALDMPSAATMLRASQVLGEEWSANVSALRASQVMAEAWAQQTPPTGLRASQLVAEAWTTDVPIRLIASQLLGEVWVTMPLVVAPRRQRVQAQVTSSF